MNRISRIAVLGGDERQAALAQMMSEYGYQTVVWAVRGNVVGAVSCQKWQTAVSGADAVILPIVAEDENGRVNAPFCQDDAPPSLLDILDKSTGVICAGKLSRDFSATAKIWGREVFDYFSSEELKIRNSVPTAEGAVAIAIEAMDRTIWGSKAVVMGYGRIGSALSSLLTNMGAQVTVAARKMSDLAKAENAGCAIFRIDTEDMSSLLECDILFNTIPACVFTRQVLMNANKDTIFIDLASLPGGFDTKEVEALGLKLIKALSLPGKYFPRTAGRIIGQTIIEYFENRS